MRTYLFCVLLVLSATPVTAQAATHIVLPDGSGDLPTIQAAIAASAWSDTIALGDGVFSGAGNRDLLYAGKPIVICSLSGDPASCVIDCEGSEADPHRAFVFEWGESPGSVLCAVTITGGHAHGADPPESLESCGGGILITNYSNPTLIDVVIRDCTAWIGGAVCIWEGSPRLEGCVFSGNLAWWGSGGGIWCSYGSPTLTDCRFVENRSNQAGGAMSCRYAPDPSFARCWFEGNSIENGFGGAIDVYLGVQAVFEQCTFVGNSIDGWGYGGAIFCGYNDTTADFDGCTFYGNAADQGGAIASQEVAVTLANTIIAFSTNGESVYCEGTGSATLTCCDLYGNEGGDWVGCVGDQYGVNGNIAFDPLFCEPEVGDFSIEDISPCAPEWNPECGLIGAWPVGCGLSDAPSADPLPVRAGFARPAWPNPALGQVSIQYFSSPGVPPAFIRILDLSGRVIRTLEAGTTQRGVTVQVWDGRNEAGTLVPSGVYLCNLVTDGETYHQQLVVVR